MQKWVSFHCKNMTANIYIFVVMFLISPCVLMKHRVLTFYSSYFMNNFNTTYFYQTHLTNYKTYRYDNWSRINITTNLFTSNIYQTPKWWHFHYFQLCHGFQTMFAFIFPLVLRCLVGASFLHSKVYTVLALKKRLWPILLLNLYLVLISFLLPLFKDQGMFCFRYIVSFPLQLYVYDALVLLNYLHVYGIIFVAFIICSLLCASMFALVDVFICFLCCYMGIFYHVLHLFCFIHR